MLILLGNESHVTHVSFSPWLSGISKVKFVFN